DPAAPKFQLFRSYVAVHNNQTLLLIDQHRAHVRVLFERYKKQLKLRPDPSQALLFPAVLHLDDRQRMDLQHLSDDLQALGFLFDMSGESVKVSAIPVDSQGLQLEPLVLDLMHAVSETGINQPSEHSERLALKMANKAAIPYDHMLSQEELDNLVAKLMDTSEPTYTPDGKRVYCWVTQEALQKLF
ncbi:MAG: DNA mismatch repair protein MutL, partial [Bacteroidota bacterium]|nr:DNA mismatch repair protein MutL [Bacteroidota bacterium]